MLYLAGLEPGFMTTGIMDILILADSKLSSEERAEIDAVCDQAFGTVVGHEEESTGYTWVMSNDWHVVVKQAGIFVSHTGIVERIATVAGALVRLGGIGGVATFPNLQKRGLASAAMQKAAGFMRDSLKVDFGLLVCAKETKPFYSKLGWQEVVGPLIIDQPRGKVTFNGVTMILPCVQRVWPPGTIDLCGLPW
jgi:Acetyltransferase (GNAT) domain